MNGSERTVFFDFDDTLIAGDSILYWKRYYFICKPARRIFQFVSVLGIFLFLLRIIDSLALKKIFLMPLCYESQKEIENLSKEFVRREIFPRLYPEILNQLKEHLEFGQRVVIISASPIFYLKYLKELLPEVRIIGTEFEFEGNGIFRFPKFSSKWGNMKGQTKVDFISSDPKEPKDGKGCFGYSDSHADLPLLNFVEYPTVVCPTRKLKKHAEKNSWKTLLPQTSPKALTKNLMKLFTLFLDIGSWPSMNSKDR